MTTFGSRTARKRQRRPRVACCASNASSSACSSVSRLPSHIRSRKSSPRSRRTASSITSLSPRPERAARSFTARRTDSSMVRVVRTFVTSVHHSIVMQGAEPPGRSAGAEIPAATRISLGQLGQRSSPMASGPSRASGPPLRGPDALSGGVRSAAAGRAPDRQPAAVGGPLAARRGRHQLEAVAPGPARSAQPDRVAPRAGAAAHAGDAVAAAQDPQLDAGRPRGRVPKRHASPGSGAEAVAGQRNGEPVEGGADRAGWPSVKLDLKKGKYALLCFVPARMGGPAHVAVVVDRATKRELAADSRRLKQILEDEG